MYIALYFRVRARSLQIGRHYFLFRFHTLQLAGLLNQADKLAISAIEVDKYTCELQVILSLKLANLILCWIVGWLDQADYIKQEIV